MTKRETNLVEKSIFSPVVFKDRKSLDSSFIPDSILFRDEAIKSLTYTFRHIILDPKNNTSTNAVLQGRCGTGKTMLAKFFAKAFGQIALDYIPNFRVEYLNCVEFKTKSKISRYLLSKLYSNSGRGFSDDEAWRLIIQRLVRCSEYLFLILDEAHILKSGDIVSLLNLPETYGHQNSRFSILFIARTHEWAKIETERVKSRLNTKITVEPYTMEQAYDILKKRCDQALSIEIPEALLNKIAQKVVETKNMRNGIEVMRKAAIQAEKLNLRTITLEILELAFKEAYSFDREILDCLTDHELLTFYSIITQPSGQKHSTETLYPMYESVCIKHNIDPHVQMSFRKYLRTLDNLEIIQIKSVKVEGCRGRFNTIKLHEGYSNGLKNDIKQILESRFNLN